MKKYFIPSIAFLLFILATGFYVWRSQLSLTGAWQAKKAGLNHVLIFQDSYFSYSLFDIGNKKFIRTYGGAFSESGGQLHANIEFDTESKDNVGKYSQYSFSISGSSLKMNLGGEITDWTRIDNGTGGLAGNWRISGRMNNGQIQPIQRLARKTLKLLSGTRFQWMAINTDTKEFFGTGGGTYTFKDGKYTEYIEFFSRDSSRVGTSLTFDGSVNGNVWTHKGLNSRGQPLHEEWTREK
jgi:hypothetical protein